MTRSRYPGVGVLIVMAGLQLGCELEEVTIATGDPVVVVHAIMRPDQTQQFVAVEYSFSGDVDPDEFGGMDIPVQSGPQIPVTGAAVQVVNLDLPVDSCGDTTTFTFTPQNWRLLEVAGVYWAPPNCPTMRPGDRLTLWIETPEGDVITGRARVPGMNGATLDVAGTTVPMGGPDTTFFNRDHDTLRITVDPIVGRLLQVEAKRVGDKSAAAGSKLFADTTAVTIPGDLPDILPGGGGEDIFRAGRRYLLTTSLADTNYFDFARSSNNPLTGRGFINRLEGGIGVFGSLTALSSVLEAVGDLDDHREGVYRISGTAQGVAIDLVLSLYLARSVDSSEVSAFMTGQWLLGGEAGWFPRAVNGLSVDGFVIGDHLDIEVPEYSVRDPIGPIVISAVLATTGASPVTVIDSLPLGRFRILGQITAEKQ